MTEIVGVAEDDALLEGEFVLVRLGVRDLERLMVRDEEGLSWLGVAVCSRLRRAVTSSNQSTHRNKLARVSVLSGQELMLPAS